MEWWGVKNRRYLIIASIISFLLLTTALIAVNHSPRTGYEYSVYGSTPIIFWIAIIVGLMVGISVFVLSYGKSKGMFSLGICQMLLSNFLLVSLYIYRGTFYLTRDDSLTYIGYGKDIIQMGSYPGTNFYPMITIIMATIEDMTGLSMVMISQLLPGIFLCAYMLGMLAWSRTVSSDGRFVTSMMLASTPILFAWFIPSIFYETLVVFMLPVFYFIIWKRGTNQNRFKFLAVLMLLFFIFGHPLVTVGILVSIIVILGMELLLKQEVKLVSIPFLIYGVMAFLLWILFNVNLVRDLENTLNQLLGLLEGSSTFSNAQSQASSVGILSALRSIIICTLDDIIYVLITLVLALVIWRRGWRNHPMNIMMACFLGGSAFLAIIILFTFAHNPFRMINLNFVMIFSVPLVGYVLYALRRDGRVARARLVTVLIGVCIVSTVLTVYQDPAEMFPNGAVTTSEVVGANWFISNRGAEINITNLRTAPWRFADMLYGASYNELNPEIRWNSTESTPHFESFLNASEGTAMRYLVFSQYDEIAYSYTWSVTDKFTTTDFASLKFATSVNHLYSDNYLTVYSRA